MEVHIVQKGDTLWKISRQYGISFDELKRVNAHLANPDYIVPGMKIFLPAKKETQKHKPSEGSGVDHKKKEKEKSSTPPVVKEKVKEKVIEKIKEPVKEKLQVPKVPVPLPQAPVQQAPQAQQMPPMSPAQPMWQMPPNSIPIIGIPCGWMPIYDADCHHHAHMGQMHHAMPMPPAESSKMPEVDMESSLNTNRQERRMPSWDMMESTELEVTTKPTTSESSMLTPPSIEMPEEMPNMQTRPSFDMPEAMPMQQIPMSPMPMPMPMPHFSQGSQCGCHFQMMPQMNHGNHCNACNQPMPYPMMPQQGINQVPQQFPQHGQNPNWYGAY